MSPMTPDRASPPANPSTWGLSNTHLHHFLANMSWDTQTCFVDAAYVGSSCQLSVLFYIHLTLYDLRDRPSQAMAYLSKLQEYVRAAVDKDGSRNCIGVVLWAVMTDGKENPSEIDDVDLTYRILRACRVVGSLDLETRAMVTDVLMQCLFGDPSLAVEKWDPQVVRREIVANKGNFNDSANQSFTVRSVSSGGEVSHRGSPVTEDSRWPGVDAKSPIS